jgi:hypothetical protein
MLIYMNGMDSNGKILTQRNLSSSGILIIILCVRLSLCRFKQKRYYHEIG